MPISFVVVDSASFIVNLSTKYSHHNSLKITQDRGVKNKATISINFFMTIFACFSAFLKGIMRTFKRCRSTARIGNEYLRSLLVLMRLFLDLLSYYKVQYYKPYSIRYSLYRLVYTRYNFLIRKQSPSAGLAISNKTKARSNKAY